jgi:hypothetical protein
MIAPDWGRRYYPFDQLKGGRTIGRLNQHSTKLSFGFNAALVGLVLGEKSDPV